MIFEGSLEPKNKLCVWARVVAAAGEAGYLFSFSFPLASYSSFLAAVCLCV